MSVTWATQPETYRQQIKRSLKLYKASFSHVIFLSLLLSLIAFVPRLLTLLIGQDIFLSVPFLNRPRLWLFLIDVTGLFVFTALLWRIRCVITEAHESILTDMKIAIRKLPLIVGAALIQSFLFFVIGVTAFVYLYYFKQYDMITTMYHANHMVVIPMIVFLFNSLVPIYLFFLFLFYLPLILTEDKGIFSAIKKSALLVWGNWWRTFWLQITPWMIYFLILVVVKRCFHLPIHIYFLIGEPSSWGATLFHIMLFALFIPIVGSTLLVQLRDLELRKAV